jgi:hypothetical protein
MVFTPTNEPWAEFYRQLFPGHTTPRTGFEAWKFGSTAVNVTRQLWEARSRAEQRYEQRWGEDPDRWPIPHPPVLLWLPECFHAACLRCEWIHGGGSRRRPEALLAHAHAVEHGAPPALVSLRPIPVAARNGPTDPRPPEWSSR